MIAPVLALLLLIGQAQPASGEHSSSSSGVPATQTSSSTKPETAPDLDKAKSLSKVRRIFVEGFGSDPINQQMQAMVISSLTESKRFLVTEEKAKADAVLRGTSTEKTSQELHSYGSGTSVETAHGGGHASVIGNIGSASSGFGAAGAAIQDSSVNTETVSSAHAAVRLVNSDGDVIWTTTQESNGGKFKGASADVAEKIAKQLARDAEKADRIVADSVNK